jgi:uncharacterized protein with GYD domain
MATYFMFGTYGRDAIRGISAARTKKAEALLKKLGGRLTGGYGLVGEKDIVLIVELPGIEELTKASIGLSRLTGISFASVPAIPIDRFDKLVAEL